MEETKKSECNLLPCIDLRIKYENRQKHGDVQTLHSQSGCLPLSLLSIEYKCNIKARETNKISYKKKSHTSWQTGRNR